MTYAQWLEAYCSGRPWKCTNSETQRCVDSVQTFTRNANLNMHCGFGFALDSGKLESGGVTQKKLQTPGTTEEQKRQETPTINQSGGV